MHSVVIVDDEIWICQLIQKIVNWESLGFHIVGVAGDGFAALDRIEENRPDLVITDIRMSGLDGIALMKAVRERKLETEFVIISGHRDFEYARDALKVGAFSYLLKPLDRGEFENVLMQLKEKINAKRARESELEVLESGQIKNDVPLIISKLSKNISQEKFNQLYGAKFSGGYFSVVIFKRDFIGENRNGESGSYRRFLLETRQKCLENHDFAEILLSPEDAGNQAIFIFNGENCRETEITGAMQGALQAFADGGMADESILTICIGCAVSHFSELERSRKEALQMVKSRLCLGKGRVIDAKDELNKSLFDDTSILDARTAKELESLFDIFDVEGACACITRSFAEAEKRSVQSPVAFHLAAYEMIGLLFHALQRKRPAAKLPWTMHQALQCVDDFSSTSQIEEFVPELLRQTTDAFGDEKSDSGDKLVYMIKKYISDHYMSDIHLDCLAKMAYLSPTYVSELFKEKTGENISEYLINYRVSLAKDMLKDLRYKIVDISQIVGYRDSQYFGRLFKKKVGVTPSDYRKLYL